MDDELQRLRKRVEELEHILAGRTIHPRVKIPGVRSIGWGLIGLLLRWPLVKYEVAFNALYGARPIADQPTDMHIITTNIHRLRKALKPHSITIDGEYGSGYYLNSSNKKRLARLVQQQEDPDWAVDPASGGGGDYLHLGVGASYRRIAVAHSPHLGVASNGVAKAKHNRSHSNPS